MPALNLDIHPTGPLLTVSIGVSISSMQRSSSPPRNRFLLICNGAASNFTLTHRNPRHWVTMSLTWLSFSQTSDFSHTRGVIVHLAALLSPRFYGPHHSTGNSWGQSKEVP
jgi:hypothetical protein